MTLRIKNYLLTLFRGKKDKAMAMILHIQKEKIVNPLLKLSIIHIKPNEEEEEDRMTDDHHHLSINTNN